MIAAATVVLPVLLVACAAPATQPPAPPPAALSDVADVSSAAPASDPLSVPSSAAPRGALVVHGTGDVNLDPAYIPALRTRGYAHAWAGLDGLFTGDDLTVVNLECPVSDRGTIVPKEFNFRCDPEALLAARAAGVEVANLANNHSGDFGPAALLDSGRTCVRPRRRPSSSATGGASRCSGSAGSSPRPTGWRPRTARAWPAATTPRR